MAQYGSLKGMALPLLTFPFGLLGSLSVLLMPEITQAHLRGQNGRLAALIDRMLRLTGYFSALARRRSGCGVSRWPKPSTAVPRRAATLSSRPGHAADVPREHGGRCHEGVGEQKAVFRYSMWDSCLRIVGVLLLLPRFGMKGFLFCDIAVQLLHLHRQHGAAAVQLRPAAATLAVAGRTGLCGSRQRRGRAGPAASLADWLTGGVLLQLAAVALGGAGWQWSALRRRGRWASAKSCGPWRQGKGGIRKMSKK